MCYNPYVEKERIKYFDLARGVGIFLVILGHIQYISNETRVYIVSFHMPLFFVMSGMLIQLSGETAKIRLTKRRDPGESNSGNMDFFLSLIKKKARNMLLPYLAYSVLDILIYIAYYLLTGRDGGWPTVISDMVMSLTLYGMSVLWFLPAIFIAEVLFLTLMRAGGRAAGVMSAIICTSAFFLNKALEAANAVRGQEVLLSLFHLMAVAILRGTICMGFLALGFFVSWFWGNLGRRKTLSPVRFSSISTIADFFLGVDFLGLTYVLSWMNGMTDLHFLLLGNPVLYIGAALAGSMGVILLCKGLEGAGFELRAVAFYGKNSLMVMATHLDFYVLLAAEIGAQHFTKHMSGEEKDLAFIGFTFCFTLIGEAALIKAYDEVRIESKITVQ